MCFCLGALIALSLKTQAAKVTGGIPTLRFEELADLYRSKQHENERLHAQIGELEKKNQDLVESVSRRSTTTSAISSELRDAKFLAGLTDVKGPGLIVTLSDSNKKMPEIDPLLIGNYIIHDLDIRDVVNELRAAGAEAVSVNDQRLTASSAVRCAGPVILVNDVDIAQPYIIKAIGEPKTLESALRMRGGIVEKYPDPKMINVEVQQDVLIGAYTGSRQPKYATAVRERP